MTDDEVTIKNKLNDMKTYQPLVSREDCMKALLHCSSIDIGCSGCPYHNLIQCSSTKDKDALYYLRIQNNM